MTFKRTILRYAHTSGHSHCCYTENGDHVITTGSDGDIRIWNGVDDDDPNTRCVGEFVLYHTIYDNRMLVSTDLNTVQAYTYPDGDRDGTIFRFTAPVTCIKVNDKFIAACSEDMTIKVEPRDKSSEFFELCEHEGPVLRIDLSQKDLLASSSGDGTIQIWNLIEKTLIKTLSGFDKVKSHQITDEFVTPSFEPKHGKFMAYNKQKCIEIVDTTNWELKKTLTYDNMKSNYSVCAFSPCGGYIAAGGTNGEIVVWNIATNTVIGEEKENSSDAQCITSLCWNPSDNGELAYIDNTGQFGLVLNITEDSTEDIFDRREEEDAMINGDDDIDFGDIEIGDDGEDEDNENCVSLEKLKNETMGKTVEDEIDEILDGHSVKTDDEMIEKGSVIVSHVKAYTMQAPFQPSSTSKSLEHRYMVWNNVGIVRAHAPNTIEVEFHDASVHHGLHMMNHLNHTMASLSTSVLALSCETPSKLVCIALSGASGSREWSMSVPNCEEVLCVVASSKLVAVATDARNLRLFSVMGTQREIVSLPGPVVSLAAHGDRLMAAYHSTAPSEDQHISALLIQAIGMSLRCRDIKVALTPGAKLTWVGYTDRGSPVTCDSSGVVRLFSMRSNLWLPICDTTMHTKGASDTFFIVEVSEREQIVRAIMCRGTNYPVTTPKPMITELPIQLPLCDIESEQSQLEESLVRFSNFNVDDAETKLKENAIKLFAIACRSEMESRAKELIEMIALPSLLPLATKYASKLGRIHLAEKLSELLPQFEEQQKERELYDETEVAGDMLLSTPVSDARNLIQENRNKNSSPSVIPKPMSVSQLKRNPFKKTPQSANKNASNPLKHLTQSALGFDTNDDIANDHSVDSQTNEKENTSVSNGSSTPTSTKPTFLIWHKENKAQLQKEKPDMTPAELTKYAMGQYKALYSAESAKETTSAKRKIATDDNADKQSGIAKLARFNFGKSN